MAPIQVSPGDVFAPVTVILCLFERLLGSLLDFFFDCHDDCLLNLLFDLLADDLDACLAADSNNYLNEH